MTFSRILKKRTVLKKRVRTVRRVRILGEPNALQARTSSQDIETEKPSQLTRKENTNFRTSKKKNEDIWILKTVYGKHSIYFSDF